MLPLLQMHPQAVPPPNNFDSFSSYNDYDATSSNERHHHQPRHHLPQHQHQQHQQHRQHEHHQHHPHHHQPHHQPHHLQHPQQPHQQRHFSPYPQSFPIRTSQPHPRPVASSASPFPAISQEHHLRRKTPNGTIDAGYDGSPTQLSPGPPPFKHMILTGSASSSSFLSLNQPPPHPLRQMAPAQQHSPGYVLDGMEQSNPGGQPWFANGDISSYLGPQQVTQQVSQQSTHGMGGMQPASYFAPNQFSNMYQPLMRASEYNVRAFCPPPPPMNESLPFGHIGWQPASSPWDYRSRGQFPSQSPYQFQPDIRGVGQPQLIDQTFQSPHRTPVGPNPFKTPRSSHVDIQAVPLRQNINPEGFDGSQGHVGQPRFKEKALARAHRSYVELLAHLQNNRRMNHIKTGTGSDASSKLFVYPKPPKPGPLYTSRENDKPRFDNSAVPEMFSASGQRVRPFMSNSLPSNSSGRHFVGQPGYSGMRDDNTGEGHYRDSHTHKPSPSYFSDSFSAPAPLSKTSPVADAKSSLELLKSLCEQSGWKWIDGMLLGGCLLYGLEHYQNALKWFSRITALDSSHVEAITNVAATLYCLDRQDEAEQNWLKAVKLRPSYLEAAEHLVGLLYKKRSKEAVDIICFVQQSLRLRPARSINTNSDANPTSDRQYAAAMNYHGLLNDSSTQLSDASLITDSASQNQHSDFDAPGYGSSGYALPGNENGRILALVHAKGTMLYSLKEVEKASAAFEEAVLISVGQRMNGIQDLIRHIMGVLSPGDSPSTAQGRDFLPLQPLLLPPDRARLTAQLVFAGRGELPGLSFVQDGAPKRAAIQTTSNSLLSLAKIFQDSMSSGNADPSVSRRPSGVGDILALYYLSLSLQESPSTANNVGILLAGVQQAAPKAPASSSVSPSQSSVPGIASGSGLALALAYYNYGLRLDPKHVHLHTNLGSLLKDIGQLDLAIQMYERAVSCDGTFDIALTNLANAVKDRGRVNDAIKYYRRAVNSNPNFAEAVCGLFTALNSVCDWRGRGGALLEGGKYDRWHVDKEGTLVDVRIHSHDSGLTKRVVNIVSQQLEDASHWGRDIFQESVLSALTQQLQHLCDDPHFDLSNALRQWAGKRWEGSRLLRLVERATRVILRRWYHDKYVSGKQPTSAYLRPRLPASMTVPSAPTVLPFHTFTCPLNAKDIRRISQRNAMRISCSTLRSPWLPSTIYPPPPPPAPYLNIGYVSSDFNNHPLAHLMQSVFGFHDPKRVKAICYATTASDRSAHRQQIEREAPVFRDTSGWSAEKLIEQIVRDEIHVLVNLNGYTRGARNEVFAARPAPIQMSFMGFAGTLGAEWCDYILADTTAIPPSTLRPCRDNLSLEDVFRDTKDEEEQGWVYSENIIYCRDTFFCCDHAQSCDADEREMTWEEEEHRRWKMRKELFPDMADDAIILGNFNQLYKIEPTTFRSWLRILAKVPKAVLWLLRFPELGESNLRMTAEAWAGAEVASRIMFTDVAPKNQHISRARVCDLFLDTPECNAHTTAADVLWSSTPLLTLPRYPYKMCSRMAASILRGALPKSAEGEQVAQELIAADETEYEQAAVRLAGELSYTIRENGAGARTGIDGSASAAYGQGQGRLAEMRKVLWESKWHCGLFDTRRWVADVEEAYEEAWRRWVAGEGGDIYL